MHDEIGEGLGHGGDVLSGVMASGKPEMFVVDQWFCVAARFPFVGLKARNVTAM